MKRYRHEYIACDSCIVDRLKSIFTHFSVGWKEHIKVSTEYEEVKMLNVACWKFLHVARQEMFQPFFAT